MSTDSSIHGDDIEIDFESSTSGIAETVEPANELEGAPASSEQQSTGDKVKKAFTLGTPTVSSEGKPPAKASKKEKSKRKAIFGKGSKTPTGSAPPLQSGIKTAGLFERIGALSDRTKMIIVGSTVGVCAVALGVYAFFPGGTIFNIDNSGYAQVVHNLSQVDSKKVGKFETDTQYGTVEPDGTVKVYDKDSTVQKNQVSSLNDGTTKYLNTLKTNKSINSVQTTADGKISVYSDSYAVFVSQVNTSARMQLRVEGQQGSLAETLNVTTGLAASITPDKEFRDAVAKAFDLVKANATSYGTSKTGTSGKYKISIEVNQMTTSSGQYAPAYLIIIN